MLSSFEDFEGRPGFPVGALLAQDDFFRRVLAPEVRELLLGDFHLLSTILETVALTQFGGQELEFSLGAARKFVVGGEALPPPIDVNIADTHVERFLPVGADVAKISSY